MNHMRISHNNKNCQKYHCATEGQEFSTENKTLKRCNFKKIKKVEKRFLKIYQEIVRTTFDFGSKQRQQNPIVPGMKQMK